MAGTVTGKNAQVWFAAHAAAAAPTFTGKDHSAWGLGDFSLTRDRGTVEQSLVGEDGNYFDQGSISVEGSVTAAKFATSGLRDLLDNLLDTKGGTYRYLAVSGTISTDTDATYLSWYLASCQVTGYDISIGDADTITEASVDFTMMNPKDLNYVHATIEG